jgi:hypothetical protein
VGCDEPGQTRPDDDDVSIHARQPTRGRDPARPSRPLRP